MERFLHLRNVAAGLVLVCIVALGMANMVYAYPALKDTVLAAVADDSMEASAKIAAIDAEIAENFFAKNIFTEGYGLVQSILGKNTLKEFTIAKDTSGKLHAVYVQTQEADVSVIGDAMASLAALAQASGADCFYLMPLSKMIEGETTFASGVLAPDENGTADAFLSYLDAQGIASLDLRDSADESGIAADALFYATDEHWTTQTAFWGFTQLVAYLNSAYDTALDPDGFYTNLDNYNQLLYEDSYLGSLGRMVGVTYAGLDDFTLIYPKFTTNFSYVASNGGENLVAQYQQSFERALLAAERLNSDISLLSAESDKYTAYLYGNYGLEQVTNHDNPDGLRVLIIQDSFSAPVAAFLATTCAQVDLIDPSYFEGSVVHEIENGDYDVVIVSFSPSNLTEAFFAFD